MRAKLGSALMVAALAMSCRRGARAGGALVDGAYAIQSETPLPSDPCGSPLQNTRVYDPKRADPTSDGERRYVTVDTTSFVPLVLAAPPESREQPDGRRMLEVALAQENVKKLEDFTREHLGGRIAVVLDDEIVSVHKIRTVIEGGRFQITRCTDRACDRILAKLLARDGGK